MSSLFERHMVAKMFRCVVIYLSIKVKPREYQESIYKLNLLNRLIFTSTGICSRNENLLGDLEVVSQ